MYNIDPFIEALHQEIKSGNYRAETNDCISTAINELISSRLGRPTHDALPDILYNLIKEIIASEQIQGFSAAFFELPLSDKKPDWKECHGSSLPADAAAQVQSSQNKTLKDVLNKMNELKGKKYFNWLKPTIEELLSQAQPSSSCGMSASA